MKMELELSNQHETMKVYGDKRFDFSIALKLMKHGYRLYRREWVGTGMCLFYQKGYPDGIPINKNTAEAIGIEEGTVCKFMPYLQLKTAAVEATFVHYVPSMADILAEDWMIAW